MSGIRTKMKLIVFTLAVTVGALFGVSSQAVAGVTASSTNAASAIVIDDNSANQQFVTDNGYGFVDASGNQAFTGEVDVTASLGTFYIASVTDNQGIVDFQGTVAITSGSTWAIELSKIANSTIGHESVLQFSGAVAAAGGNMTVNTFDGSGTVTGNTVDFESTVTLGSLQIGSGNGTAALGQSFNIVDITGAMAITTMTINSGNGSTAADVVGGTMTVNLIAGDLTGTTLNLTAGNGAISDGTGEGGNGGALAVTTWTGDVASVTTNITSGNGATGFATNSRTGGDGGALDIADFDGAFTGTTVNITSGNGGAGLANDATSVGGAGGAMASLDFDGAITAILNITAGNGGVGGTSSSAASADGGAGGVIGTTDISFAAAVIGNTTVKGGNGGNAGASTAGGIGGKGGAGAAVTVDSFLSIQGVTTLTGGVAGISGAGGAAAGDVAGVGGAVVVTDIATQTGNIVLTGGAGGAGAAGSSAALGAAGANGGAVTVADFSTKLAGDLTIQGGLGSEGGAGAAGGVGGDGADGGAATLSDATLINGATADGSTIQVLGGHAGSAGAAATAADGGDGGAGGLAAITDMDGTPDIATLTMTGGNGGAGGAAGTTNAGDAAGVAGTSIVGIADGTAGHVTTIAITGGDAGNAGAAGTTAIGGAGSAGALATLTYDTAAMTAQGGTGSTAITVTGGTGGNGGNGGSTSGDGAAGVAGGAATLSLGGAAASANIVLDDGTAGTAGTASGGAAGALGAGGAATLAFTATHSLTGTITAAADGEGLITTAGGKVTVVGAVGTSSKAIKKLTTGHATGFSINGDLYVDGIDNYTGTVGLLEFTSNASGTTQIVSGTIQGVNSGTGTDDITLTSATNATFQGAVGRTIADTSVAGRVETVTLSTGTATFNSFLDASTITTGAAGTMVVHDTVTTAVDLDLVNTTIITLGKGIVAGETVFKATQGATAFAGGSAVVTLNLPEAFNSGTITLIDYGTSTTAGADALLLTLNAGTLATYTAAEGGDNTKLDITAVKKSSSTIAAALGVTKSAARGLDAGMTSAASDAAVSALMNTVLAAGGAAATEMASQLQGSQDGLGATSGAATASTGAAAISVGSSRMAALRSGTAYASRLGTGFNAGNNGAQSNNPYASTVGTGFSAGSGTQSNSMWMKPFASFGDQKIRNGVAGYEADTYGLAIGADTKLNSNSIAGLGFSYANTDVDGKGAGNSHSDISSYQVTAYGDYTENDWYVEGLVGYAYNDIDTSRNIAVTSSSAKGDANSNQYMVSVNAGMPIKVDAEGLTGTYFTPTLGLSVTHVDNKAYTETGAGVLNLKVSPEDITIAKASLGGRLHASVENSDGIFVPELRAKILYDMAGDDGSSSNTFTGGGSAFQVDGMDVAEFATSVGVGFSFKPNFLQVEDMKLEGVTFSVNYDAEFKEDYTGQSGNFSFRYAF